MSYEVYEAVIVTVPHYEDKTVVERYIAEHADLAELVISGENLFDRNTTFVVLGYGGIDKKAEKYQRARDPFLDFLSKGIACDVVSMIYGGDFATEVGFSGNYKSNSRDPEHNWSFELREKNEPRTARVEAIRIVRQTVAEPSHGSLFDIGIYCEADVRPFDGMPRQTLRSRGIWGFHREDVEAQKKAAKEAYEEMFRKILPAFGLGTNLGFEQCEVEAR